MVGDGDVTVGLGGDTVLALEHEAAASGIKAAGTSRQLSRDAEADPIPAGIMGDSFREVNCVSAYGSAPLSVA